MSSAERWSAYMNTLGAPFRGTVTELGIQWELLRMWVDRYETGKNSAAVGIMPHNQLDEGSSELPSADTGAEEVLEVKVATLEMENQELRATNRKLMGEIEFLLKTATYFTRKTA